MKPKTKMMAYSRLQSLQALKGAWQRLSMMLTLVVLTAMTSWAQTFGGGDGSAESPYMIYTVAQWDQMAELINQGGNYATAHYKLGADISGVTTMVGSQSKPFSGTFDGDGKTISVNISDDDYSGVAPFRYILSATIRNLRVTGSVGNGTRFLHHLFV